MSTSKAAAKPRSTWIISPAWDMAFLVATPLAIVPIMWLCANFLATPEQISLIIAAFATLGHHLPGFMRCYGDRELFARFKWRFLLTPPLFLATAILFTSQGWHGLTLVLLLWGTWHGLMQTYGFMRIYDLKRGVRDVWTGRLDLWLCLAIFTAGMVFSDARVAGVLQALWQTGAPSLDAVWLYRLRWFVGSLVVAIMLLYALNLFRTSRSSAGVSWTKVLLAVTTGWLYWITGTITTNVLIGVAMFEIFHATQYYAIVWTYNRRLADRAEGQFGPLSFLFQDRWFFLGIYLVAIFLFGSFRYFGNGVENATLQAVILAMISTSTLLHFYYDGFIWKVRETNTQLNLDIEGQKGSTIQIAVPGLVHAGKMGCLFVIFFGLVGLQLWQQSKNDQNEDRLLSTLAAWTPKLPETQAMVSRSKLDAGNTSEAIRLAREVVEKRPRMHTAHASLGQALMAADQQEAAADSFAQASQLAVHEWDKLHYHAQEMAARQRWPDAESALRRALDLKPQNSLWWQDLATACRQQGKIETAIDYFRTACDLSPQDPAIRADLVATLSADKQHDRAIATAREGVVETPESLTAQLSLATALNAAGRHQEALPLLTKAHGQGPPSADVLHQLGIAQMQLKQLPDAQESLKQAIDLNPKHAQAHFQLGNVFYFTAIGSQSAQRPREFERGIEMAIRRYRRCIELAPGFLDAYNNLGAILHSQEKYREAMEVYDEALKVDPENPVSHYNLGMLYYYQGEDAKARLQVLRAIQLGYQPPAEVLRELDLPVKQ